MTDNREQPPFQEPVKKTGVLLVNLGTPEAPTPKAVKRYLKEFLSDVRVVDAPRLVWWFVLKVILLIRPKPVAKAYAEIWWPDGSPLMVISKRQQAALQQALKAETGQDIPVALAMTYGQPSMEHAAQALRKQGVESIIVLPLYPQNSSSTTAAVFDRLATALKPCPHMPELTFINDYHNHPDYITALANSVKQHWQQHGQGQKLLMSFHGIPQRYEDKGDPYPKQCRTTAKLLAEQLGLSDDQWLCSFQSRFGREEWVKPYTDETLKEWGANGVESVNVISPAFAADCLETLEELKEENREYFLHAGGKDYSYVPALNDNADHIKLLVNLVKKKL